MHFNNLLKSLAPTAHPEFAKIDPISAGRGVVYWYKYALTKTANCVVALSIQTTSGSL